MSKALQVEQEGASAPAASHRHELGRSKSVILTPERKFTILMIKFLLFFKGASCGLDSLSNVYLVTIIGWTPLTASLVWIIKDITGTILQPFVGDVVDRIKIHKYTILVILSLLKIVSGICMLTSTDFGVMVFRAIIDGIFDASFLSAVTAMTLGVVGKTRFHKKVAASNEIINFLGVSFGTVICGFVSYATWPDVEKMFWLLVVGGVLMLVCTLLMLDQEQTEGGTTVDHRLARGRSSLVMNVSRMASMRNIANQVDVDSDDEEGDDEQELLAKRAQFQNGKEQDTGNEEGGQSLPSTSGTTYTQVLKYSQMYSDPKRRRSLICLSLVMFTYHMANATTSPLLGQFMAMNALDARKGLPITTSLILANSVSRILVTWALTNDRAEKIGYNKVLLLGSAALLTRLVLVSIFVNYWNNFWALGATQILDGVGVGCLGMMVILYSHILSRRTGHYNLNMAMVFMWSKVGAIIGRVSGGAIATMQSYEIVFPILAVVAIFPMLFVFGVSTPDLKRLD